jgi:hypothetical protein
VPSQSKIRADVGAKGSEMFGRKPALAVAVGDQFEKLGPRPNVWVVEAVLERDDHPPHVRLVQQGGGRRSTVALSMLAGPDYRRVVPFSEGS